MPDCPAPSVPLRSITFLPDPIRSDPSQDA